MGAILLLVRKDLDQDDGRIPEETTNERDQGSTRFKQGETLSKYLCRLKKSSQYKTVL